MQLTIAKYCKEEKVCGQKTNEKGITLVALVITIVLLIILSTVTINVAMGENGLINQARRAKMLSEQEASEEEGQLNTLIGSLTNIINGIPEITVKYAQENNMEFTETTRIADDLKNVITVPGGFHIADDSGMLVEEGIVIEDKDGNQFVWIPVGTYKVSETIDETESLTNNLSRRTFSSSSSTEVQENDGISNQFYGEENENSVAKDRIDAFKSSATDNGGFYIGRYEVGTETERTETTASLTTPLVQANMYPYTNVTRDQAKIQSEEMYSGDEYVVSELMSSYAWDTALNFICQTNVGTGKGYALATTNEDTYANIGTEIVSKTGEYTEDEYSNIYDFLGNCFEFTTEYSNNKGVIRGGDCANEFGYAAYRYAEEITAAYPNESFRVQLYIKEDGTATPTEKYTDIYVTRYTDGTLGFCSTEDTILGKQVAKVYGNIKGQSYTVGGTESNPTSNVPWFNDRTSIKSVVFVDDIVPYSTAGWFIGCTALSQINNIENLDTSGVVDMQFMFAFCTNAQFTELDLSTFDTSNVTNMMCMFYESTALNTITLGRWDTSKVTNMRAMFGADSGAMALTTISGLEYFNTSNVTTIRGMFMNCEKIKTLNLSSFDTSKVTDMQYLLANCRSLETVTVSKDKWNDANANTTGIMNGCTAKIIEV